MKLFHQKGNNLLIYFTNITAERLTKRDNIEAGFEKGNVWLQRNWGVEYAAMKGMDTDFKWNCWRSRSWRSRKCVRLFFEECSSDITSFVALFLYSLKGSLINFKVEFIQGSRCSNAKLFRSGHKNSICENAFGQNSRW